MNFLSMAANKIGSAMQDKFGSPDSVFGRMANQFGLTHPNIDTPQGITNPDMFAKGLGKTSAAPGIDIAEATRQQEAMARQNGFRNYDEMMAWARQRANQTGGTVPGGNAPGSVGAGMAGVKMMHPKNMFETILQKWQAATGGGQ